MISRIRIEAYGHSADEVERTLYPHADLFEHVLGVSVNRGECVIERAQDYPDDSVFAFKGRLVLHPDIGEGAQMRPPPRVDATQVIRDEGGNPIGVVFTTE